MPADRNDPFDLDRFVRAQDFVIRQVRAELAAGRKQTHWMWFVFPQMRGLGLSERSQHYGIGSLEEARAYLAHPVLGPRLRECIELALSHRGRSALQILGEPDDMKLRSCLTLFAAASGDELFPKALDVFFAGDRDPATLSLLHG